MPEPEPVLEPPTGSGSAVMRGDFDAAVNFLPKRSARTRTRTRVGLLSTSVERSPSGTTTRISFAVPSVFLAKTARSPSALKTTVFLFLPRTK